MVVSTWHRVFRWTISLPHREVDFWGVFGMCGLRALLPSPKEVESALGDVKHGHHRFCKLCWPDIAGLPPDLSLCKSPGADYLGAVSVGTATFSPGCMIRHLTRTHPAALPAGIDIEPDGVETVCDELLMDAAAHDLVATDLDSFSSLTRKGMRAFCRKLAPQTKLGGRFALTAAFDRLTRKTHDRVKQARNGRQGREWDC